MRNLLSPEPPVKPPSTILPYFDCVVIWLRIFVDRRTREKLRKHCGSLEYDNRIPRWDRNFRQRLDFKQPTDRALRWIASRTDGLINYAEVTLDLIFDTSEDSLAARSYLDRYRIRRWHRREHGIRYYDNDPNNQRYDGPPTAPNVVTDYLEDHCRITGELNCLHLEWRLNSLYAVRAAGILRPRDVLTFDHRAFWQERLRLYAVDPGRLGRLYRNRNQRTHSHLITPADRKHGNRVIGRYETIQEFIDDYRSTRIDRVLTPLSTEPFLPPTTTPTRLIMLSTRRNYPNFVNTSTIIKTSPNLTPATPLVSISNPVTPPITSPLIRPSARMTTKTLRT